MIGGGAKWQRTISISWHRCTCSPPRATSAHGHLVQVNVHVHGLGLGGLEWSQRWFTSCNFSQVHLGRVEVQLGFASLDFNSASMDLIGVCGGSPRATPLKFNFCNLKFNFSTWSSTRLRLVELQVEKLNFKLQKLNLRPSRWSSTPITVELNIMYESGQFSHGGFNWKPIE